MAHLFFRPPCRTSERSFFCGLVRLGKSRMRHEPEHVRDVRAALFFLVSLHSRVLPLRDLSCLQCLIDFVQLAHFLGACKKIAGQPTGQSLFWGLAKLCTLYCAVCAARPSELVNMDVGLVARVASQGTRRVREGKAFAAARLHHLAVARHKLCEELLDDVVLQTVAAAALRTIEAHFHVVAPDLEDSNHAGAAKSMTTRRRAHAAERRPTVRDAAQAGGLRRSFCLGARPLRRVAALRRHVFPEACVRESEPKELHSINAKEESVHDDKKGK